MIQIKLKDGTVINTTLNGNNYITKEDISKVDFSDKNLSSIIIGDTKHENQKLADMFPEEDGIHIIFKTKTAEQVKLDEQEAIIDSLLAYILGGS